mmetsp:Transcript_16759/g.38450  ORF Transcript_16759/g.38450 Transcript_16759/m.38450 type:complete len:80 (+) Transcript_16759:433-672(+)
MQSKCTSKYPTNPPTASRRSSLISAANCVITQDAQQWYAGLHRPPLMFCLDHSICTGNRQMVLQYVIAGVRMQLPAYEG